MVVHDALTAPDAKAIRVVFPSCLAAATVEVVSRSWFLALLVPLLSKVEAQEMVLGALVVVVAGESAADSQVAGRGTAGDDISCFGAEVTCFSSAAHLDRVEIGVEKVQLLIFKLFKGRRVRLW